MCCFRRSRGAAPAIEVAHLTPGDDVLIVQDDEDDSVVECMPLPKQVVLVATGGPDGCSAKGQRARLGTDAAGYDRLSGWMTTSIIRPAGLTTFIVRRIRTDDGSPGICRTSPLPVLPEPIYRRTWPSASRLDSERFSEQ